MGKRETYRTIYCSLLWDNDKFLDLSETERSLYFFLYTNPATSQLGVYDLTERKLKYYGYNLGEMEAGLTKLQDQGFIYYSIVETKLQITLIYMLVNFTGSGGQPTLDLLKKEAREVEMERVLALRTALRESGHYDGLNKTIRQFFDSLDNVADEVVDDIADNIVDVVVKAAEDNQKAVNSDQKAVNSDQKAVINKVVEQTATALREKTDNDGSSRKDNFFILNTCEKIRNFAKEQHIQTNDQSIMRFVEFNLKRHDQHVFFSDHLGDWQKYFREWAAKELDAVGIVGSEHYEHLSDDNRRSKETF